MNILGSVGQLYMFVLLVLLFLGSGLAIWRFIDFVTDRNAKKQGVKETGKQNQQVKEINNINENGKVKGGFLMANNGWIKLAVFSFVGIIVSVAILGLTSGNSMNGMNMNMGGQGTSIHQQHQQQNGMGNMNTQGGMNMNNQMGNMQMQGNVNGGMNQNQMMMMQQLQQMQMQINQMQQQMGMMNGNMGGNMQMQQGGSGNMGGMGMMNGMMGGMGMMNMGSMSSMPQNGGSMSSMPQNGGSMSNMQQNSGSSGGMGMMMGM